MVSAGLINNPSQRAAAWAKVDRMLVDQASAIGEEWDILVRDGARRPLSFSVDNGQPAAMRSAIKDHLDALLGRSDLAR